MKKAIIQFGEKVHVVNAYLRQLAYFTFKILFFSFRKMNVLEILGT
jgi:hypothetical protein